MYIADEARYDGRMEYRRCGRSGLQLPLVSLGLWHNFGSNADFDNMKAMCKTAFDNGITHFDLANNYGPYDGAAEENFGKIINGCLKKYRDELVISTKAGYTMWPGPYGDWGSRKYLLASLDQSLKRMDLPYVDIFYHHRMDPATPLEETMMALDTAVKSGRALYAGVSNYDRETAARAKAILTELKCPFIINQVRFSIFDRHIEADGLPSWSSDNGVGVICFSPLAQGLLSDRYLAGIPADSRVHTDGRFLNENSITEATLQKIRDLDAVAAARGQSLAQMALSWVAAVPGITSVLIGASRPEQIIDNCKIVGNTTFSADELWRIGEIAGR